MGMWQRMKWPLSTSLSGGSSCSQMAPIFRGQRVWNTQPDGGSAALGFSKGVQGPLIRGHEPCGVVVAVGNGVPPKMASSGDSGADPDRT